jgi:hypothetical protein
MAAKSKFDMSNRRGEIPRMLEILDNHKDWASLTFFQYKGGNADLIKPITRIRVSRRFQYKNKEYIITIGSPNYAEREYIKKFKKEQSESGKDKGCWPDDFFQKTPVPRKTKV